MIDFNKKNILVGAGFVLVLFAGIAIGSAFKQNKFASVAVLSPAIVLESPSPSFAPLATETKIGRAHV